MNSIISDWYRGNLPHGMEEEPDDEGYRNAEQERSDLFDALMDTLREGQREQLLAMEDACNWTDNFLAEHAFVRGFRLGARLMAEVFGDIDVWKYHPCAD